MINFNRSQSLGLDINRHIAIDAGAGTGKTTVMASRYCNICFQATKGN